MRKAREMAPCFLLLDNLEIILGSGVSTGNQGIRSGRRTAHQALDRLLSTLLVEIDGLSSSRTLSKLRKMKAEIISKDDKTGENTRDEEEEEGDEEDEEDDEESRLKSVIVIATTSDINLIDR
jgi:SpoVK/Ycf46/Vps4 family AAA+-type ATPase